MKVLGINISHDASIAEVVDGEVVSFYEESRFKRVKHYEPNNTSDNYKFVFNSIEGKIDMDTIDKVVITSYDRRGSSEHHLSDDDIIDKIKYEVGRDDVLYEINHHLHHVYCARYFSKFDEALCIVLDGGGAKMYDPFPNHQEIESVYHIDGWKIYPKFKHMTDIKVNDSRNKNHTHNVVIDDVDVKFSSETSSGIKFSQLCGTLGMGNGNSSGKLMGLASYGKFDTYNNEKLYTPASIAYELQEETFNNTVEFIENALKYSDTKNIIISGGYALNCTNNYKYTQHFPELNFFIDPVAYDAGTAIGAALWGYYDNK